MGQTDLDILGAQVSTADHVKHPSRGSADYLLTGLELPDILADAGPANAGMTRNVHIVTKRQHNGLNLYCQFAGGGEDKRLGLADVLVD